ncbi:MAG: glycosyltransferase family 2 protein [Sphingobacteriales bacterium]|nr:MAG: glycosyltransferase family 2 protein [Sphingobacteriales bacterium]
MEIIILDDHSVHCTLGVCQSFANTDSRFKVLQGTALSAGCLGKNYACRQLADKATGNFFLFVDADGSLKWKGRSLTLN